MDPGGTPYGFRVKGTIVERLQYLALTLTPLSMSRRDALPKKLPPAHTIKPGANASRLINLSLCMSCSLLRI